MANTSVMGEIWDSIARSLDSGTAQRLLEYRASPTIRERVDYLGDRANEGLLTAEERSEYEYIIRTMNFLTILQLKGRRRLNEQE